MKCLNPKLFFEEKSKEKGFRELIQNFNLPMKSQISDDVEYY